MAISIKPKPTDPVHPAKATLKNEYMDELGFSHNGAILEASTKAIEEANQTKPIVATPKVDHLKAAPSNGTVESKITKSNYGEKVVLDEKKETFVLGSSPIPVDKLCNVNVGGKMTINLGNYQSAQIMASLTLPCTLESVDEAYEFASQWVSDKIESAVAAAKKGNV